MTQTPSVTIDRTPPAAIEAAIDRLRSDRTETARESLIDLLLAETVPTATLRELIAAAEVAADAPEVRAELLAVLLRVEDPANLRVSHTADTVEVAHSSSPAEGGYDGGAVVRIEIPADVRRRIDSRIAVAIRRAGIQRLIAVATDLLAGAADDAATRSAHVHLALESLGRLEALGWVVDSLYTDAAAPRALNPAAAAPRALSPDADRAIEDSGVGIDAAATVVGPLWADARALFEDLLDNSTLPEEVRRIDAAVAATPIGRIDARLRLGAEVLAGAA